MGCMVAVGRFGAKWRHSWQRKVFPSTGYVMYCIFGGIPVVTGTGNGDLLELGSTGAVL